MEEVREALGNPIDLHTLSATVHVVGATRTGRLVSVQFQQTRNGFRIVGAHWLYHQQDIRTRLSDLPGSSPQPLPVEPDPSFRLSTYADLREINRRATELRQVRETVRHARAQLVAAINAARQRGRSWEEISLVLHLTPSEARRRYGKHVQTIRRE
jgi:predicted transcriptional regulator